MERIGTFQAAEKKVLEDVSTLLSEVRSIVAAAPTSATEGVALLAQLRDIGYEDLNQIQHEYLILAAAKWLMDQKVVTAGVEWYWNPRQTGGANEPDLRAKRNGKILVSAEITTSRRPIGTIADRMKSTLGKLSKFPGKRFYFVRTESMAKKANALVKANKFDITVASLPHVAGEL
jgi:hypothetical protein